MTGEMIGFAAVVLTCGVPVAAIYAYYRVRKLKTEERLAAIARGVEVPFDQPITHLANSRRAGILLVATGLGWAATFALLSMMEREAVEAAPFAAIPVAIGIGFLIDAMLVRRELHPTN